MADELLARMVSGADRAFQLSKDFLFERQLLWRCFENETRVRDCGRELIMHGNVFKQRNIVAKEIGDGPRPLWQCSANLCLRLEHANGLTRGSEQISNAMAHQAAADNAYFLRTHLCLPQSC